MFSCGTKSGGQTLRSPKEEGTFGVIPWGEKPCSYDPPDVAVFAPLALSVNS